MVKIDIQSPIIDVEIGDVKLKADTSDAALKKALDAEKSGIKEEAFKEVQKLEEIEGFTSEDYDQLVDKALDLYGQIYNHIFGDGAVAKVYEKYPQIRSVVVAFEEAMNEVNAVYDNRQAKVERERKNTMDKYKKRKKK